MTEKAKPTGLALMREPFDANQISKLPKPTKFQTDELKRDFKNGVRCDVCGGWHHPKVVHLDYVGHAALTDRLLDCDINWNWEPIHTDEHGIPVFDRDGGMWIRLTVCNVTRMGYGDAQGKSGGNAIKEVIGDALRNAAMRFGAALDLWHKGELHVEVDVDDAVNAPQPKSRSWVQTITDELADDATPRDKAEAVSSALCAQFRRMKGAKQIDLEWDRRAALITSLEEKHSDLWGNVIEAYETRLAEIKDREAAKSGGFDTNHEREI